MLSALHAESIVLGGVAQVAVDVVAMSSVWAPASSNLLSEAETKTILDGCPAGASHPSAS